MPNKDVRMKVVYELHVAKHGTPNIKCNQCDQVRTKKIHSMKYDVTSRYICHIFCIICVNCFTKV